jgi:hypothetical protein
MLGRAGLCELERSARCAHLKTRHSRLVLGGHARIRLDIYLNDHLAGAMLGVELSRRAAAQNGGTELGEFLQGLHEEIVEDRQTLRAVMGALGVEASLLKPVGAWCWKRLAA